MATQGVDERCMLLDDLRCVWLGVADLDEAQEILQGALGYLPTTSGQTMPAAIDVQDPFQGDFQGEQRPWTYYTAPNEHTGAICVFVDRTRPAGAGLPRGWDCVEAVVADVDAAAAALGELPGVRSVRKPFTSDLSDLGSNVHRSGIWLMPWGTHLILTTGVTTPVDRVFPQAAGGIGRVFEVHLRTDDFAATQRLYSDVLGMPSLMNVRHDSGPMHEAWSLPTGYPVAMSFFKSGGIGTGGGAVELQGHPVGSLAERQPTVTRWPGGTAMVTFATSRLDEVYEAALHNGLAIAPAATVPHGPMAGCRAIMIQGQEQELLQVVEQPATG